MRTHKQYEISFKKTEENENSLNMELHHVRKYQSNNESRLISPCHRRGPVIPAELKLNKYNF